MLRMRLIYCGRRIKHFPVRRSYLGNAGDKDAPCSEQVCSYALLRCCANAAPALRRVQPAAQLSEPLAPRLLFSGNHTSILLTSQPAYSVISSSVRSQSVPRLFFRICSPPAAGRFADTRGVGTCNRNLSVFTRFVCRALLW